ncbi:DUF4876 domain-containing protein [Flavobacterium tructae]|uniref:DUF4876 domain-containing protein n=1 Tax=Flavobacterium tructae TaxID=1114873 RepID=A0A1S1J3V1_9FLAO|nr:DUF4876 domain-containing protein [Flavobacterium tructae]OHT44224.1 DUF4876 domain-containing protein [Flavobacterium tructae]OXB20136.1 DUF4876 domain-containing protein [Flavobacterium tructae]
MKIRLLPIYLTIAIMALLPSCSKDDDNSNKETALTLTLVNPEDLSSVIFSDVSVSFKERNTGKVTQSKALNNNISVSLDEGSYEISIDGKINYTIDGNIIEASVSSYKEAVVITGGSASVSLNLFLKTTQSDFVIEEVFFTGTKTPQGKQYSGDKYFKIHNNTDKVLYADGLMIAQSEFMTTDKQDYTPNIMAQSFAVSAVAIVPGNGTTYPIAPGEFFVIAEDAIDHKEYNSASLDLRKATFEFYTEDADDVDNPSVPNMESLFSSMVIHNRGFKSFVIARMPINKTKYLTDYTYNYEYNLVFGGESYPMGENVYSIPNSWIVDAVNLSVESEFKWIVTAPSLDKGWTYCGKVDSDATRYGKSVRRKTLSTTSNGKKILKDTNNSTLDFSPEVKPSLMN